MCIRDSFHREKIEHSFKVDSKEWLRLHPGKFLSGFA